MEPQSRKHPRLKEYDYSLPGCYYITIHTLPDAPPLSQIINGTIGQRASIRLLPPGEIAGQQLAGLEERFYYVRLEKYVVMPTHIHAILRLTDDGGTNRPALTDVVCAYKSLTTRALNQAFRMPGRKWFQTSFYETVLRNEKAYQACWRYIDENPDKWALNPNDI